MVLTFLFIKFTLFMGALVLASDKLVDAMSEIAKYFRIPSVVIGSTIVGIGTSLPEVASGLSANLAERSEIVVSNVLGSNIINAFSLILIFLVVKKIDMDIKHYKKTLIWFIFSMFAFYYVVSDGLLDKIESYVLMALFATYLYTLFKNSRGEKDEDEEPHEISFPREVFIGIASGVVIMISADFAIDSATEIAKALNVSDWVIGILLVALGTSLPEFTVSVMSAYKGDIGMSIGNILGSNVANILLVLGVSTTVNVVNFDINSYIIDVRYFMAMSMVLILFFFLPKLTKVVAGIGLVIFLSYMRHMF